MFVFLQGNRRALPLCVMLLIMQAFGEGQVGYDASARGEAYSHRTTINQALIDKPSVPSVCFVITLDQAERPSAVRLTLPMGLGRAVPKSRVD